MDKLHPVPGQGTPSPSGRPERWTLSRFTAAIAAVVLLLNGFALGVAGLSLTRSRRQIQERAATSSQNLARILERDLEGTIKQIDLALLSVKSEAERLGAGEPRAMGALDGYIQGVFTHIPYLDSIRATDADGNIIRGTEVRPDSRVNLADRDYFVRLKGSPHAGLVISSPLVSRFNGQWVLVLARRLERVPVPGGAPRFAGVVYANITLDQFAHTLSLVDAGPRGTAALLGQDLSLIAAHPPSGPHGGQGMVDPEMDEAIRRGETQGTFRSRSNADGLQRTVSFRRLQEQPFCVVTGLAEADYMAIWWKEAGQAGLLLALFLLLTIALASLTRGYWRREADTQLHAMIDKAQAALYRISEAAQEAPDLQDLFRRIHAIIDDLLPARNLYLALYDESSDRISFPYFVNEMHPPPPPRKPAKGITDLVLRRGVPVLLTQAELDELMRRDEVRTRGPHQPLHYLGVPLVVQRRIMGVLAVETYDREVRFSGRDMDLLQFVSAQVAASIERKRAEEERRRLEGELHQAQKLESIGNLAGGVAHDMNNVLGAISGMASFLQEREEGDPTLRRGLGTILRAALRGSTLVKNLSEFARRGLEEPQPIDLNAAVRRIVGRLAHANLQKVEIQEDLEPALPPIQGDPSVIGECLLNLAGNALDAMASGGRLAFTTRNGPDRWIELAIRDTGHGMTREVLDKAMDPFFTTKPMGKGAGMGLSRVYGAMRAHGGTVELTSEVGQGTTVRLRFPARTVDMQ